MNEGSFDLEQFQMSIHANFIKLAQLASQQLRHDHPPFFEIPIGRCLHAGNE